MSKITETQKCVALTVCILALSRHLTQRSQTKDHESWNQEQVVGPTAELMM